MPVERTLPGLGGRVAARGALVLLDVEGAATCKATMSVAVRSHVFMIVAVLGSAAAVVFLVGRDAQLFGDRFSFALHRPPPSHRALSGRKSRTTATAQSMRLIVALSE